MDSPSYRQGVRDAEAFNHYRIVRLLGQGGMATVYDAYDPKHDRHVALKVLKAEWQHDAEAVAGFLREARAAGGLSAPHIAMVYDSGEQPVPFIAMELLEGPTLAELLRQHGRLPVSEAVRLLRGLGEALAYAHSRGRIHRDVKPSNILLSGPELTPKLADFGIAMIATEAIQASGRDRTHGTPCYMCPEQWRGEPVDARCDLFSLGLTFYEMLTGRRAFQGETAEGLCYQITFQPPPPLEELAPQAPPRIRAIVDRLIAKRPEDRFQSARELLDALDGTGEAAPGLARYLGVVVTAGVVFLVMVAGSAVVWWTAPVNHPPVASSAEVATEAGQAVEIDLGSLVSDPDGDALELSAELPLGAPGRLDVQGARARYDPETSFAHLARGESREVRFLFHVSDGQGSAAHAAVVIRVEGAFAPNRPPIAADDRARTGSGERAMIDVLANDHDPDPNDRPRLIAAEMAQGSPGNVRIVNGQLDYDPGPPRPATAGRLPIAEIRYTIADGTGTRANGRAWVAIEPPQPLLSPERLESPEPLESPGPRALPHDDQRCRRVVERFQLGGALSDEDRELLQGRCAR
jgi:hypothetical protein